MTRLGVCPNTPLQKGFLKKTIPAFALRNINMVGMSLNAMGPEEKTLARKTTTRNESSRGPLSRAENTQKGSNRSLSDLTKKCHFKGRALENDTALGFDL